MLSGGGGKDPITAFAHFAEDFTSRLLDRQRPSSPTRRRVRRDLNTLLTSLRLAVAHLPERRLNGTSTRTR